MGPCRLVAEAKQHPGRGGVMRNLPVRLEEHALNQGPEILVAIAPGVSVRTHRRL